jgi:LPXTG-motif cell wall-anchored protein
VPVVVTLTPAAALVPAPVSVQEQAAPAFVPATQIVPAAATTAGQTLPETGVNSTTGALVLAGSALTMAGGAILFATRRKSEHR